MRKSKALGIRRRRRPVAVSLFCLVALAMLGLAVFGDGPTASYANANCGGQSLAGRWVNTAPISGPDVMAATIAIPCASPRQADAAPGPIDLSLTVRCLHVLSCDWQAVPASQTTGATSPTGLTAHYDQQNFDRTVLIEPVDANHMRLKMTSRFKGLGLGSVEAIYLLERAKG